MEEDDNNKIRVTSSEATEKFNLSLGRFRLDVCPLKVINAQSYKWMNDFNLCQTFHCLPDSGGINDQDAKTMNAFEIILRENSKIRKDTPRPTAPVSHANPPVIKGK